MKCEKERQKEQNLLIDVLIKKVDKNTTRSNTMVVAQTRNVCLNYVSKNGTDHDNGKDVVTRTK